MYSMKVCNTKQSWYHKVGCRGIWCPRRNVHCHLVRKVPGVW